MIVDTVWRNTDLLTRAGHYSDGSARWELWSGLVPASPDITPSGATLLAQGLVDPVGVTTDLINREILLNNLVDGSAREGGTPSFFRLLHRDGNAQLTAAMAINPGTAEVIVTVDDQPDAVRIVRLHSLDISVKLRF